MFFAGHPHFVCRIQFDSQHPFHSRLYDCRNFCPLHMLAQEHAEHGRRRRILPRDVNKMHPRRAGGGRHQQAPCAALASRLQHDLIPIGLVHLFHTAAREHMIQFFRYCPKADSI